MTEYSILRSILYLTLGRPLNISTINCIQQSGFCDVATTTLNHSKSGGYDLDLEVNRLEIKNRNLQGPWHQRRERKRPTLGVGLASERCSAFMLSGRVVFIERACGLANPGQHLSGSRRSFNPRLHHQKRLESARSGH